MVRISEDLVRKRAEHNESLISTLEELSLHQEDIERIEHIQHWCRELKILLLQSNLISKIENLYKLKKLEYLNLAINNIERIENLERLESLNKLDLTLNFIGDLTSVESLCDNYNLKELILTGNPCCDYPNYRNFVIATLPQLEILDCEGITKTDRLLSQQKLKKYREIIVQHQAKYAIERDEQKIRFQEQKEALSAKMEAIEDEDERIKAFWGSKSEHCPEIRTEIAKYHKICRDKHEPTQSKQSKIKKPILFAPCGRPYNLNQAKLQFAFKDDCHEYILELNIYKYLDTSQIDVIIETNYIRITAKGKVFQIVLNEEVKISEATVQRSQITGHLVVKVPKMHFKEAIAPRKKTEKIRPAVDICREGEKRAIDLNGPVDIANICSTNNNKNNIDDIPDLV